MARRDDIEIFLELIYRHAPSNTFAAISYSTSPRAASQQWRTKIAPMSRKDQIVDSIHDLNDTLQIYARIAPLKARPTEGRGLESDSAGVSTLWVDIDAYGKVEQAIQSLRMYAKPPTLIASTGRGISAYWLLSKFETDISEIKARNKKLALDFKAHNGDSCYDLARVMRIPGTYNLKPEQPALARILEYRPERIYDFDDFDVAVLDDDDNLVVEAQLEPLPDDFEGALRERKPKLWRRITKAEDAPTSANGEVDHSRNDWYISCTLLTMGYSAGVVASVLMHLEWESGAKYRRSFNTLYVLRTIAGAVRHVLGTAPRDLDGTRPSIYVPQGTYDTEELVQKAFEAFASITDAAGSPVIYISPTGEMCELAKGTFSKRLTIHSLNRHSLRRIVQQHITWYTTTSKSDRRPTTPPDRVLDTMLAKPDDNVPVVKRIVQTPTFVCEEGKVVLLSKPGYHPRSMLYYDPAIKLDDIPERPTDDHITEAKEWLLGGLLHDFPFADEASKLHAMALLLLPFVRELIDGPTPFHLVDAPIQGSGKGLCAQAALSVYFGSQLNHTSEADGDDEWRKRLLSLARTGSEYLWIDNITKSMGWSSIAAALTSCSVTDRILGQSTTLTVPIRFVWVGTANNAVINDDLLRRIAYIRLNWTTKQVGEPKDLKPQVFKHYPLLQWASENRAQLVRSAIILCIAGLQRGKATANKNSFEHWSRVISTIFNGVNMPGFLENDLDLRQMTQDDSTDRSTDIFEAAVTLIGWGREFTARQLAEKLTGEEGVMYMPENIRNPQKFIGIMFSQHRDRIVAGKYVIRRGGSKRDGFKWSIIQYNGGGND